MNPTQLQQGATLIIALIILLVMTVIGVNGMALTTLEEKMAGNAWDRDLAFQAADSALRAGETCLRSQSAPPDILEPATFSCNPAVSGGGFYPASESPPIWERLSDADRWNDPAAAVQFDGHLAQLAAPPSYVVEQVAIDYGTETGASNAPARTFRITAHAMGGTPNAIVIVQSMLTRY